MRVTIQHRPLALAGQETMVVVGNLFLEAHHGFVYTIVVA